MKVLTTLIAHKFKKFMKNMDTISYRFDKFTSALLKLLKNIKNSKKLHESTFERATFYLNIGESCQMRIAKQLPY